MREPLKHTAPFIPAWAEKELVKPSAFDKAELDTLRAFYLSWEALHGIANDSLHRKQKEEAAQCLVGQAHVLRRMYATLKTH